MVGIRAMKQELAAKGVSTATCTTKADITALYDKHCSGAEAAPPLPPTPPSSAPPPTPGLKQMKGDLGAKGVSTASCVTKADIQKLWREHCSGGGGGGGGK